MARREQLDVAPRASRLVLRRPRSEDAQRLAQVHVQAWRETYAGLVPQSHLAALDVDARVARWRAIFAQGVSRVWVAEDEGTIVGFASSGPARDASRAEWGEIYAIYLLREAQKRGMGRALMHASARDLAARGYDKAYLWVLRENPACAFYRRIGGEPIAERVEPIGGAGLPAVAFAWDPLERLLSAREGG